ncbi:hypothetical protein O6H91_17G048600 [Diphasiastrum complanatum]|uniref:Uncharacterized protein n=1 Tax=Diphasiastrum complanatum TaxID=34168 RepID=A0ACC2B6J8_DIPCM|nr:hypothetical protein O6H91_17G048600 [Diphasiastrum complanatum]
MSSCSPALMGQEGDETTNCTAALRHTTRAGVSGLLVSVRWTGLTTVILLLCSCFGCIAASLQIYGKAEEVETRPDGRGLLLHNSALAQDIQALLSVKTAFMVANPIIPSLLHTWTYNSTDPCTWKAVQCSNVSGEIRVTSLDLSNSMLRGSIPAEICNVTALESLFLDLNQLNGTIPSEIGSLGSLKYLNLCSNAFSGTIPASFRGLNNLQYLNMADNSMVGGIPDTLALMCGNLQTLNISNNPELGGQLPLGLNACGNLTAIDFEITNLQGSIPSELGQIPGLQYLNLGSNNLTGSIPDGLFSNCASLSYVDLSLNHLTGDVPPSIGNCSNLSTLMLCQNNLKSIPLELGGLTNLTWLFLGENQLEGEMPRQILSLTSLTILDLRDNGFNGRIPSMISQLQSLQYLMLEHNSFSGSLPPEITKLSSLLFLDVSDNPVGGTIPNFIRNLTSVQILILANNLYTGSLLPELGFLPNLQFLDLGDNQLTGSIPSTIGNLQNLLWLRLANNLLTGAIPHEIGNCGGLMWLNLANNSLTGSIPENIGNISSTAVDIFAINDRDLLFLPKQLGECRILLRWLPNLEYPYSKIPALLIRDRCQQFWNYLMRGTNLYPICSGQGSIASTGYIQLSMNMLNGSLPISLRQAHHFSGIFLSDNQLSGNLRQVFSRPEISLLKLQHNSFTGLIPSDFSNMECIAVMDLSFNNLSGSIPISLERCSTLVVFNLSYNPLLTGPIPEEGQFATFSESSYLQDSSLCYKRINSPIDSKIPMCKSAITTQPAGESLPHPSSTRTSKLTTWAIASIILGCTLGIVFIVAAFALRVRRGHTSCASDCVNDGKEIQCFGTGNLYVTLFSIELPQQLTHKDLITATDNFDGVNLIGSSGFGVVYKAKLMDGTLVAIKKLAHGGSLLDHVFLTKIEEIGNIRQKNLVPLLGCTALGSDKLLLYRYMENGSLDDWLHELPRGAQTLDWPLRYNIALGIARGLKFLHHGCSPPIIHGDIKARNILLDQDLEPRLTDFALAQVLKVNESYVTSIIVGNVGYIPPEYSRTWRATMKGDIYGFGVLLLQLISGRRPVDVAEIEKDCRSMVEWVVSMRKQGRERATYDPIIASSGAPGELQRLMKLATWCTEELPSQRPTMEEVLGALEEM